MGNSNQTANMLSPTLPKIKTDCLSIITSAAAGSIAVTAHGKMLARIWNTITACVETDVANLVAEGIWQWIPAHLPITAVGQIIQHNTNRLSMVDWRANRLVDALAKNGAATVAHP